MKYIHKHSIWMLLLLLVWSCDGIDDSPVNADAIIQLRILDQNEQVLTSAIGDGETTIVLEAKIPTNATSDFQTITFKSSAGDFIGIGSTTHQVPADSEGYAYATLRLPLDDNELFVSAEIGTDNNLYKAESSIDLIDPGAVIAIRLLELSGTALTEIPKADGTRIIQVEGQILHAQDALNNIQFIASSGAFQVTNNTSIEKPTNTDGIATVSFVIPQSTSPVFFTAKTVSTPVYQTETNLTLAHAYADGLFIEPNSITMNTNDPNTINVFLNRTEGKVSLDTPAVFEAFQTIDGTETPVGRFTGLSNALSNADEALSANFYADTNDIVPDVPVTIRVSITNDAGQTVSTTVDLMVAS